MPFVTKELYEEFKLKAIDDNDEFERLSDIASDVIYDVCAVKPDEYIKNLADYKKAVCLEIEMLSEQGGVDAILGFSEMTQMTNSESLGSYSVSGSSASQSSVPALNGIPISPMSLACLKRLGVMQRWSHLRASDLYAE